MSHKKLISYTTSHIGLVRSKNDDSSYSGSYLNVVADGMGGHAGGDTASALTVLALLSLDHEYAQHSYESTKNILIDTIHSANSLLRGLAAENPALSGMGTTTSAILLTGDELQFAHIGDSRVYRLSNNNFEQVSTDHTYVQQLVEEGRLSPSEASTHPNKNVVTRILGDVDASPEIDSRTYEAICGERWLLCSDGLTDVVRADTIASHMRRQDSLKNIADTLITLTLEAGSPDNVTVTIFDIVPADAKTNRYSQGILVPEIINDTLSHYPNGILPDTAWEQFSNDALTVGYNPYRALATFYLMAQVQARPHILAGAASLAMEQAAVPTTQEFLEYLEAIQNQATEENTFRTQQELMTGDDAYAHPSEDDLNFTVNDTDDIVENDGFDHDGLSHQTPERKSFFSRRFYSILAIIIITIISITAFLSYSWVQAQYYVGVDDNKVAIFRGVPQRLGPIPFSSLEERTDTSLEELDDHSKNSVNNTITTSSKEAAEQIIRDLQRKKSVSSNRPFNIKTATPSASRSS